MKRVTIDAPSPERSSPATPSRDQNLHNGLPIPKHMALSGQEGYRTPTIEDYEMVDCQPAQLETGHGGMSSNGSRLRMPHIVNEIFGHQSPHASSVSLGERFLEKLHWRERIRHYTWTFFTMTMATGGIANVLWNGVMSIEIG